MDDRRFDELTRRLAQGVSRRAAVKVGVAALLAGFGLRGHTAAQQCPPGQTANRKGDCSCPAGTDACPNGCFDRKRDANNCGDCGNVCRPGEVCRKGECRCPAGVACASVTTTPAPTTTSTTTAAPTTSTTTSSTTVAPTTTTTTTSVPTTTSTTTTTTTQPFRTCPAGADTCSGVVEGCGTGNPSCYCYRTFAGRTFCGLADAGVCTDCGSNTDCNGVTGLGSACVVLDGAEGVADCGTCPQLDGLACIPSCPGA